MSVCTPATAAPPPVERPSIEVSVCLHDRVPLGAKVEDRTTGLRGLAVARVTYLHGCPRIAVQPRAEGSQVPDLVYVEESALAVLGRPCR